MNQKQLDESTLITKEMWNYLTERSKRIQKMTDEQKIEEKDVPTSSDPEVKKTDDEVVDMDEEVEKEAEESEE